MIWYNKRTLSRQANSPETPLCRFAFKDGRHGSVSQQSAFGGSCYAHGTLEPRVSRLDHLFCDLASLAHGSSSPDESGLGYRALSRAVAAGRISPQHAALLLQINAVLQHAQRCSVNREFVCGYGPWDRLRSLFHELGF
jgi:hypothetical protein